MIQDRTELSRKIASSFNLDDLRALCFDLNVDYDNLAGDIKRLKVRALISYMEQRGRYHELLDALQERRPHLNWFGRPLYDLQCPYRGLLPFREADARFFFGRQTAVHQVEQAIVNKFLVAVVGSSGSGKSSLVFAGLLPNLRQKNSWLFADFRPGNLPFRSLSAALLPLLEPQLSELDRLIEANKLANGLELGRLDLNQVIERVLEKEQQANRLLLIADQFEELYTLCEDPETRHRFLDVLLATSSNGPDPQDRQGALLLTIRADFMEMALAYRPFADALQNRDIKLGPMNREELMQVIKEPAARSGTSFEPGLAERILDDVKVELGSLPLLEFALTMLWTNKENGLLTHNSYEEIEGVAGALTRYADQVYERLGSNRKEQARHMFTQLVRPGENTEDTGRSATRAELGNSNWRLAQQLADTRLVVTGRSVAGHETVEIAHEALIHRWWRLRKWMEEDRSFRRWQESLRTTQQRWQESGKEEGFLLRGASLAEAENWREKRFNDLSQIELEFIEASSKLHVRNVRLRNYAIVGLIVLAILLAFLSISSNSNARKATFAQATSEAIAVRARSRELSSQASAVSQDFPERSLLLSAESLMTVTNSAAPRESLSEEVIRNLLASIGGHPFGVGQVSSPLLTLSPNDRWLVTGIEGNGVRLWDLAQPNPELNYKDLYGHEARVYLAAISSDNRWLATAGGGIQFINDPQVHSIRLWDLEAVGPPEKVKVFLGNEGSYFTKLLFSPDNRWLIAGSSDATIHVWDLTDPSLDKSPVILRHHESGIADMALTADNHWLVTASSDGVVLLWNMLNDNPFEEAIFLFDQEDDVIDIDISADDKRLAVGYFDGPVHILNLDSDDPSEYLKVLDTRASSTAGSLGAVRFSPDGHWLLTVMGGGGVNYGYPPLGGQLWDLTADDPSESMIELHGHEEFISSFAISPNSRWLITSGRNGNSIRLWDLTTRNPDIYVQSLYGHDNGIQNMVVASSGRWLVTTDGQTMRFWDLTASDPGSAFPVFRAPSSAGSSPSVSTDGNWLVTTGSYENSLPVPDSDGTRIPYSAWIWESSELRRPFHPGSEPIRPRSQFRHDDYISDVVISQDSRWIITAGRDKIVNVWDLESTNPESSPLELHHQYAVDEVALSADNRWLATISHDSPNSDYLLLLWDLNARPDSIKPLVLVEEEDKLQAVAFSPNGKRLVASIGSGTVQLWSLEDSNLGDQVGSFDIKEGPATVVVFSPNSQWLVALSQRNYSGRRIFYRGGQLWNLSDSSKRDIPSVGISSVSFSPDGKWFITGNADNTIHVWESEQWGSLDEPITLRNHTDLVISIAVSPNGVWLATGGKDNAVSLWNLERISEQPVTLRSHVAEVVGVYFSSDNRWLVSVSKDGIVRYWPLDQKELIELACRTAGRNLTDLEWVQYFPGERYRETCGE